MGKGLITGEAGEGLYTINIEIDKTGILQKISVLNEKITEVLNALKEAQVDIEEYYDADYTDPSADPDEYEPPPDTLPAGDAVQIGAVSDNN